MRVEPVSSSATLALRDDSADRPAAHDLRPVRTQTLDVAINGATWQFEGASGTGSMRNAMIGSLRETDGLTATIEPDGRLVLVTDDARHLVLASLMAAGSGGTARPSGAARLSDPIVAYLDAGAEGTAQGPDDPVPATVRPR